jgi:hypothetical protein
MSENIRNFFFSASYFRTNIAVFSGSQLSEAWKTVEVLLCPVPPDLRKGIPNKILEMKLKNECTTTQV